MKAPVAGALLLLAAVAPAAKFTTQRFDVNITIQPDGTLLVREEIAVTFTEAQRGLIRKLPSITEGRDNKVRRTRYELVGVMYSRGQAFASSDTAQKLENGDWQVRIGNPKVTFTGPVTYRIDYKIRGAMTPFNDSMGARTELYWNVLPTEWATPIPSAHIKVLFPPPKSGPLRARILSGDLGNKAALELEVGRKSGQTPGADATLTNRELDVKTTRPLNPGQAVTVVLSLPGDTVKAPPPEIVERPSVLGFLKSLLPKSPLDYLAFFFPFLALGPIIQWRRRRSHREGPLVTQFDPPEGTGPAECGLILDGSVDSHDIVGGILNLAQKGAAKVRPDPNESQSFELVLQGRDRGRGLTDFEDALYRALEPYGSIINASSLRGEFGTQYRGLVYVLSQSVERQGLTLPAGSGPGAGCGCVFALLVLSFIGVVGEFLTPLALIGSFLVALIGFILVMKAGNLTEKGARVRTHIRGLYEFIRRADADELRRMSQTMPAQALYERLLPFAIAFGFVEQWVRAFEEMQLSPPEWFQSPDDGLWNVYMVNELLLNQNDWTEAVSPPADTSWSSGSTSSYDSGSSFSSGDSGFSSSSDSGGGGGGGGGDSW